MLTLTINKNATLTLHSDTALEGLNLTLVMTMPDPENPSSTITRTREFTRDGDYVTTKFYASEQQSIGVHRLVLYKNYGASGQGSLALLNFRLVPVSDASRRTSGSGGGGGDYTVDSQLSATSTNPVQNKVIKEALDGKQATLRDGENMATINGYSLLNGGNITIQGGSGSGSSYAVQLQGVDTERSVRNTYTDYKMISGAITSTSDVPTLTDTGSYASLEALIEGEGYSTTMNPDFILDMVSDGAPFFYVAFYKVVSFSLEVYYYKVTSSSLFSSFTDYILGSTAKTYCVAFEGVRDYYYWNGSTMTKNPTSTQTIKFLDGASIMKAENTIYEIVGDIDLNGTVITPAAGSIIKFAGGRIKNGTIDGQNGISIECPDVIFFENMRFRRMVGEQVFRDTWFTDVFDEGSMKGIPHLTLSRNYDITVESMLINKASAYNGYAPHDKLILEGNGHTLKLPTQMCKPYKVGTAQFINTRYIEVYDLTITLADSSFGRLQVVFDTNIGIFHNVKFNGSCRFAGAYTNPVPNDVYGYFGLLPQLQFYGCDIRVPTFAVEGAFNQVIARDSIFARSTSENTDNTIFSIAPWGRNDFYLRNSFVDMENCYMEGGWETPNHGRRLDNGDGTYTYYYTEASKKTTPFTNHITYSNVKFKNCELVTPYIGFKNGFARLQDNHSGTTSLCEFEDCKIYTSLTGGRFYTDNLVFKRCLINVSYTTYKVAPTYPFVLNKPTGKLEFLDCTFDTDEYTSKSGRHWDACKDGGLSTASDKEYTHYVLCICEYPSDDFKVILKNNTFIEGQYRNKVAIYCDAPSTSGSTLADRVECSGNRYALGKPRMMESGSTGSQYAKRSSAYGKITEGFWSTPTTNMLLPIEHTSFRGSESMSDFSFAACTHDFDFSIGNIYSTTVATAYYIFDALRSVARKLKFDE